MKLLAGLLPFVLTGSLMIPPASAAEVIGHRGASADAPENTLASFKLGYAQGADGDELDLYLSKDGKIVVIHDATTKRTGGVDKKIVDQTFDELRAQNVGAFGPWAGKGFSEKIPTLDEALALVPPGKKFYLEIKCHAEILPAMEVALKKAALKPEQTPIITFHYDVAEAAKKKFPDLPVYWLASWAKDKTTGEFPKLDDLIAKAKAAHLDGLDLEHNFPLDAAAITTIKAAGLKCYVWTLDDPAKARQMIADGVDGITTNRPGALRKETK